MRIRYYALLELSGYSFAAQALIEGFAKAGIEVEWLPLVREGFGVRRVRPTELSAIVETLQNLSCVDDLAALLAKTSQSLDPDINLIHTMPEHWSQFIDRGKRNVGFTAWETDQLPPHWVPLINTVQDIILPSEFNRQIFSQNPLNGALHVLPHVLNARKAVNAELNIAEFSEGLDIPSDNFVFYTIDTWSPRKNIPGLLDAYVREFSADDAVTLIVKTDATGYGPLPFGYDQSTTDLLDEQLNLLSERYQKPLPNIILLPYALSPAGLEMLHLRGDCFVSATHGEGWGLSIFEAVGNYQKPVIAPHWSALNEFLGDDYPGLVPVQLEQVPIWPAIKPIFWPPQRWAQPDLMVMGQKMRAAANDSAELRAASGRVSERLTREFSQEKIVKRFLDIFGEQS